jgi:hypothetical protein
MKKEEKELELYFKENNNMFIDLKYEILGLIYKFNNSGQSGGSAPYITKFLSDSIKNFKEIEKQEDLKKRNFKRF